MCDVYLRWDEDKLWGQLGIIKAEDRVVRQHITIMLHSNITRKKITLTFQEERKSAAESKNYQELSTKLPLKERGGWMAVW